MRTGHRHLRHFALILTLLFFSLSLIHISAQDAPAIYTDPDGRFTMPIPDGWEDLSEAPYAVYKHESGATITAGVLEVADRVAAQTFVGEKIAPELAGDEPAQTNEIPLPNGTWTQDLYLADDGTLAALLTLPKDGVIYMILLQAPSIEATQAVSPALNQMLISFVAGKPLDLSAETPITLDEKQLADLDAYVADALERFGVPGASVAVVQDGKVIFSKGYGVTNMEEGNAVDNSTLFMIGSTTKSMTSFIAATLVDEGKLDWDQPATDLLPDFALSDADATSQIRYRDLLNMTSGLPRYDTPLFLEKADPERILEMVSEPKLVAAPGKSFNYSNQMVSLGGFAAAVAAGGTFGPDIADEYAALMQARVFDAIGMPRSTLDPSVALADPNHATSYTLDITQTQDYTLLPIDPAFESFASPVAPAGAVWSSSDEMGRYLATQMSLGTTPEGTRVVSEENLRETHTPAIAIAGGTSSYDMGWITSPWNGLTLIAHDGSTVGFVSDMSYLDEAQIGVIVLANRTGAASFEGAVREYVYELAYGLEHTADARYTNANKNLNAVTMQGLKGVTLASPDQDSVADFLGTYDHGVELVYDKGLFLVTGYGHLPLYGFGVANRYLVGGALPGFGVELTDKDGTVTMTVGSLTDPSQMVVLNKN